MVTQRSDRCFFDISADGEKLGRIVFQLDTELCPKTCANFAALCRGDESFGYKGPFSSNANFRAVILKHRIRTEKVVAPYMENGLMMRTLRNRMDGYHVAFGEVVSGWETLDAIEALGMIEGFGRQMGRTKKTIIIADCGEL